MKQFLEESKALSPDERGHLLEKSDGIINTHKEVAAEGQTTVSALFAFRISLHFTLIFFYSSLQMIMNRCLIILLPLFRKMEVCMN